MNDDEEEEENILVQKNKQITLMRWEDSKRKEFEVL